MTERTFMGRLRRKILRGVFRSENRDGKVYMTVHERPKRAADVGTGPGRSPGLSTATAQRSEPMAVVMQGPPFEPDDFTLETFRIYADHMPDCRLIFSTWKDTPKQQLDAIAALGVDIVLCDKPKVAGLFNVNMQITTASAGVRRAVEGGAEWVMKTRTDQRIYHPEFMSALAALAESFPPTGPAAGMQRHRIVGVGHGTLKFGLYHLTDQTVFGHARDMLKYWTPPLSTGELPRHWPRDGGQIYGTVPIGELCRYGAAESYLTSQFLLGIGRELDWTLADSWAAFRDHLCVVDYGSTDFYWVKPQIHTFRENTIRYSSIINRKELGFLDWVSLHSGRLPVEAAAVYEDQLAKPYRAFDPTDY